MSDTFFTGSPHWAWYIILYFFIGGIAGGAFFLASMLHLFGRPADRPLRFWHMLIESNTGQPMFKA